MNPRSLRLPLFLALLALSLWTLAGCSSGRRTGMVEPVTASTPTVLGPGDVIKISFTTAPEMNLSQKIRADGRLNLPQVGEVKASGKTLRQFQAEIKALYRGQINNPDVVVTLESAAIQVYVSGSVRTPGKLTFDRPTTVLQAIMEAGGVNQFGNLRRVHLIRISDGVQRTQMLDLRPILAGRTTEAFYVKNGDIIQVPQSAF